MEPVAPEIEDYYTILENLSEEYPQMSLGEPLSIDDEEVLCSMNSCEREFVFLLLERELLVFREPEIEGMKFRPDFFVYNVKAQSGRILELTLFDKKYSNGNSTKKSIERKKRQMECLEKTGVPYSVMYREQLESVREYSCPSLF